MKSFSATAVLVVLAASNASAAPACMTKSEARAAFPRQHLYWSGTGRCWSDRAGRAAARKYRRVEASERPPTPTETPRPTLPVAAPPPPAVEYPGDTRMQRLSDQRALTVQGEPVSPPIIKAAPEPEPPPAPPAGLSRFALAGAVFAVAAIMLALSRVWLARQFAGWERA